MYRNEKSKQYHINYRKRNRDIIRKKNQKYYKENPWMNAYYNAKQRCTNPNNKAYKDYGKRGILFLLSKEEIKKLWFRDKAYNLEQPSIHRKDNNENYTLDNCQFIEKGLNTVERNIRVLSKIIFQFDLQGNFIKEWFGIRKASRELKINQSDITQCAKGNSNYSHVGGFIWKYKNE